uniref:Teretoxin Tan6.14 n=1 Tax=Terebra anilis TaxID=553697 RepID=T6E_TERAN|nr:RecName: Full=Teretoxin Tan6.14; Flags: Precursor [Terebra anilis]
MRPLLVFVLMVSVSLAFSLEGMPNNGGDSVASITANQARRFKRNPLFSFAQHSLVDLKARACPYYCSSQIRCCLGFKCKDVDGTLKCVSKGDFLGK